MNVSHSTDGVRRQRARAASFEGWPGLQVLEGRWRQHMRFWPQRGRPALTWTGESLNRLIMDGQYLHSSARLRCGPFHMESLGILGLTEAGAEYTLVLGDKGGFYCGRAHGRFEPELHRFVLRGRDVQPVSGQVDEFEVRLGMRDRDRYDLEIVYPNHAQGPFRMLAARSDRQG
jgi:hypothetical protein